jgi:hypothetical protein
MRLKIESSNGVILELDYDHMAILPTIKDERALAFSALIRALALLSGIMPRSSSCATGDLTGEYSPSTEQCPAVHMCDNVVLLKGRQAAPVVAL